MKKEVKIKVIFYNLTPLGSLTAFCCEFDSSRFFFISLVSIDFINKFGGVVGENHVCFIVQINKKSEVDYILLSEILRTDIMDRLFRCISGSTNVSSYELNNLPFPDPVVLKAEIKKGSSTENAVRVAFGLDNQHEIN